MARRHRPVGLLWVVTALAVLIATLPAGAQAPEVASRGIAITPPNVELEAAPGQRLTVDIGVDNLAGVAQLVSVDVRNFRPDGDAGQAVPVQEDSSYSMARWINVGPANTTIAPGGRRDYRATITVPDDAESGSHFGSVVFTPSIPNADAGGYRTTTEVATLILLRIPGDANEQVELAGFTAKPASSEGGPVTVEARFANTGNVHVSPKGTVVIKDMFGRSADVSLNPEGRPVLPGANRRFVSAWPEEGLFGRYTATLRAGYTSSEPGQSTRTFEAKTTFYVIPPAIAVGLAVGLLLLLLVVALLVARRRRRKPEASGSHFR